MNKIATDSLTGLLPYAGFVVEFGRLLEEAIAKGDPLSCALLDIDWFGRVNAELGKEGADAVLRDLSTQLQSTVVNEERVYRYGGDAFMILMPKVEKEEAFLRIEEWRRGYVSERIIDGDSGVEKLKLTVSAGVAACPDDASDETLLLRKCNEALYRAKVSGRNKVCLAREERMVTKTVHYTQGQLEGLSRLSKREGINEATFLREGLDDLLRKYNS